LSWSNWGDDIRPEVRVGIAIGEVIIADNTMAGGGVVMAQRLDPFGEVQQQFFGGLAEFGTNNYIAAEKHFIRSFELNSNIVLATAALASTYGHLKQKKKAEAAFHAYKKSEVTESFAYNVNILISFFHISKVVIVNEWQMAFA
jgi:hypothetical protein